MGELRLLRGWGRSTESAATVVRAVGIDDLRHLVATQPARGLLARGLGRSYNDAAQNAGGTVLDVGLRNVALDPASGLVTAGGSVSIEELMRRLLPRGWFVPVTPGTRHVTVGGAIACDVHGKNHHVDGSWMDHVTAIDLLTPDGTVRTVGPDGEGRDLFWATAGGLGLTGLVLSCTFRAIPVESSRMTVETVRTANLDETMRALIAADGRVRYSVAWVDLLARGAALGRGVVTLGEHARSDAVGPEPLAFDAGELAAVPSWYDLSLLNRASIRAFNEVWYRKAPRHRTDELQTISSFFHPLDAVGRWNHLYGRRGFVQYQMVVPDDATGVVRSTIEAFVADRVPSFLVVLKRFGPGNEGPLSFPIAGWTLALDIPVGVAELGPLLDRVDREVVDAGGRVYLAKDGRVAPSLIPTMYPRLEEWRDTVAGIGPADVIGSDLDRRLGLRRKP